MYDLEYPQLSNQESLEFQHPKPLFINKSLISQRMIAGMFCEFINLWILDSYMGWCGSKEVM